ncbi:MAG: hypothetical protein U0075_18065 [Thermomicrobiales bacterium]
MKSRVDMSVLQILCAHNDVHRQDSRADDSLELSTDTGQVRYLGDHESARPEKPGHRTDARRRVIEVFHDPETDDDIEGILQGRRWVKQISLNDRAWDIGSSQDFSCLITTGR